MRCGTRLAVALGAALLLAASCTSSGGAPARTGSQTGTAVTGSTGSQTPAEPAPRALEKAACGLPHDQLLRVWRGTDPQRSGQIVVIPQEPNFLGSNFPHSGPWDYLQDVPLLFYGPGVIPALGSVNRPATLADVAPTQAALLGYDFPQVDGHALPEIDAPAIPPKLIVTLVWDAG